MRCRHLDRHLPSPLLAALLLALLVVFPGPETAQAQVQEIKINYGFSREFPPFSYERDGEPAGFEVELLQAVLSEVENLEITMKPLDWIQVQMDLSDGVIELTTGMARTEQRMLLYDFSDQPTVSIKVRLFTQTTNRISNPTQLRGRRVAVKEGSLYQRVLEEIGGMNIKLYPTESEALKALYNGDVDAFCGADKTAIYTIRHLGLTGISPVGTPLDITDLHFAVNRDQQWLLDAVNLGMRRVVENGEYDALYRKWFVVEMDETEQNQLIQAASEAAINAYAPYSQTPIGAAVLGMSGATYTGCNVENGVSGFSATALTVAVHNAVNSGETDIRAAVAVAPDGSLITPTAEERRLLQEFGRGILVLTEPEPGRFVVRTIAELLPYPYQPDLRTY